MSRGLDELDALGARFKHFVAGNHEHNLERSLMQRAPELFNVVRVPELLRVRPQAFDPQPLPLVLLLLAPPLLLLLLAPPLPPLELVPPLLLLPVMKSG